MLVNKTEVCVENKLPIATETINQEKEDFQVDNPKNNIPTWKKQLIEKKNAVTLIKKDCETKVNQNIDSKPPWLQELQLKK